MHSLSINLKCYLMQNQNVTVQYVFFAKSKGIILYVHF